MTVIFRRNREAIKARVAAKKASDEAYRQQFVDAANAAATSAQASSAEAPKAQSSQQQPQQQKAAQHKR